MVEVGNKDCVHSPYCLSHLYRPTWCQKWDQSNKSTREAFTESKRIFSEMTTADSSNSEANSDCQPQTTRIEIRRESRTSNSDFTTTLSKPTTETWRKTQDRESGLLQETITGNIGAPIGNAGRSLAGYPLHNRTPDSS